MTDKTTEQNQSQNQDMSGENVDKIRDILFGKNMQAYDQRFAELEKSYKSELALLENKLAEKIAMIESLMADKEKSLKAQIQETDTDLSDTLQKLDAKVSDVETVRQNDALAQKEDLLSHIDELKNTLLHKITTNQTSVDEDKISKSQLANIFAELANKTDSDQS